MNNEYPQIIDSLFKKTFLSIILLLYFLNLETATSQIINQKTITALDSIILSNDELYFLQKENKREEVINKILKIKPDYIPALLELSQFKMEKALTKAEIIQTESGNITVYSSDFFEAREILEKVLKIDSQNIDAHYKMAVLCRELPIYEPSQVFQDKMFDKAEYHFNRVISLDPYYNDVYDQYALLNNYKGDLQKTIKCVIKQIELKPNNMEFYVSLTHYLKKAHKNIGNDTLLQFINSLYGDPKYYLLAEYYRRENNLSLADSMFSDLVRYSHSAFKTLARISQLRIYAKLLRSEKVEQVFWSTIDEATNHIDIDLIFNDLKFIINVDEFEYYKSLSFEMKKNKFFQSFWEKHNPLHGASIKNRLLEQYKRFNMSESNYEYLKEVYNFQLIKYDDYDKQGIMNICYGEPTSVWVDQSKNQYYLNWYYNSMDNEPEINRTVGKYPIVTKLPFKNITVYETTKDKNISERYAWKKDTRLFKLPHEIYTFRASNGLTNVEVAYKIPYQDIFKGFPDSVSSIFTEKTLTIFDAGWVKIVSQSDTILSGRNNREMDSNIWFYRFVVYPDSTNVTLLVHPLETEVYGKFSESLMIPDYSKSGLKISDIIIADTIEKSKGKNIFNRNNLKVIPSISSKRHLGKLLNIYFEIYNLAKNMDGKTLFMIEYTIKYLGDEKNIISSIFGKNRTNSISTEYNKFGKDVTSIEYISIDVNKLIPGKYILEISVKDVNGRNSIKKTKEIEFYE
jgi:tetratricopeptide (TPR) repeat protein